MRGLTLVSSVSSLLLSVAASAQASWQIAYPVGQTPPPIGQWRMAFDELHGEALMLFPGGGQPGNSFWRWNGTTWDQPVAVTPPHRFDCYVAYDAARQRVVLYGGTGPTGTGPGGFINDLWEWDGAVWQQRAVAAFPPARIYGAFAFDRARNVCVLFSGSHPSTGALQTDTWEWNGTTWTQALPAAHPLGRRLANMTFDPSTQRLLLYGGDGPASLIFTDTWTWDGVAWVQRQPATPPWARHASIMVSDLARSRVVLCGGLFFDFQTWEWDGSQWHASVPGSPGPLVESAATYDTQRGEVLMFGGASPAGFTSDLWRYKTNSPANATPFGAGCAGSVGVPYLANAPYSLPWIGDTARTRVYNLSPITPGAIFVTSLTPSFLPMSLAPIGAPGCDLLLQPDVLTLEIASESHADSAVSIPFSVSLAGLSIYQQAFPFEAGVNPLGMIASNGLRLILGIR